MTPTPSAAPVHAPTLIEMARAAVAQPAVRDAADRALDRFRGLCTQPMPHIPGCETWLRLAIRIHRGMTGEQAAAREYAYRWSLFLRAFHNHLASRSTSRFVHGAMCYPAPHLLGQ
jgi:hypothetical protein